MKSQILIILVLFTIIVGHTQEIKGIKFEEGLDWEGAKAKARVEGKYVFIFFADRACGHCTFMNGQIFSQGNVGHFMNGKFVSLSIDVGESAEKIVNKWGTGIQQLIEQYHIAEALPTYLFFNSSGELVHRDSNLEYVSFEPEEFLDKVSAAFHSEKQYYTLLSQYEEDQKTDSLARWLATFARNIGDSIVAKKISDQYIKGLKNVFNKEDLWFLATFTRTSQDRGFSIFMAHPKRIDNILKMPGFSEQKVAKIIMKEVPSVSEVFQSNSSHPDWNAIETSVADTYSRKYAKLVVAKTKLKYFKEKKQWLDYVESLLGYNASFGKARSSDQLNGDAWEVFKQSNNRKQLEVALKWSEKSLRNGKENLPYYLDTKANLLYKLGRWEEAIKVQEKAIALIGDVKKETFSETLKKMRLGEETW